MAIVISWAILTVIITMLAEPPRRAGYRSGGFPAYAAVAALIIGAVVLWAKIFG